MNDKSDNLPSIVEYRDAILRLSADEKIDVDKLERLYAMQEAAEKRRAEWDFNDALSKAQAEMTVINEDAYNPQTRSRYSTYAALDRGTRQMYTKYAFSVSFDVEEAAKDMLRVVGFLHHGPITRRYTVLSPVVTAGFRGGQMMTPQHAYMSAVTYGKRNLIKMMFNLATGREDDMDDDGNGGVRQPPKDNWRPPADPPHDLHTGELIDLTKPQRLELQVIEGNVETYVEWGQRFLKGINQATELEAVKNWKRLNGELLMKINDEAPKVAERLDININKRMESLIAAAEQQQPKPPE